MCYCMIWARMYLLLTSNELNHAAGCYMMAPAVFAAVGFHSGAVMWQKHGYAVVPLQDHALQTRFALNEKDPACAR